MENSPAQPELNSGVSPEKVKKYPLRPILLTIFIILIISLLIGLFNNKKPVKQVVVSQPAINEKLILGPTKPDTYMTIGNYMINTKGMSCKISGEFRASLIPYTKFTKEDKYFMSLGPTLKTFVFSGDKIIDANANCSPIEIISKFAEDDLINKKIDSIAFYSSDDFNDWTKEKSQIDFNNKTIKTKTKHAKYYAVMAESLDMIGPNSEVEIIASKAGELGYYPPVILRIIANDNKGGTGIDHAYFKLDNEKWQTYKEQIIITKSGAHIIEYYAVDKSKNIGVDKRYEFYIIN